jgi:phage N-6-adenine-methyltransferase
MDWETPHDFFEKLNDEFHFDLDVCATSETAKCEKYFSPEIDGLKQEWVGVCWMNPPYGREIGKWIKKAYEESLKGATVVCSIPSRTDTGYWHEYVMRAKEIRFLKGRLKFVGAKDPAPFPNAIVVFSGPDFSSIHKGGNP